jgi:hypothetical protein
MTFGVGAATKVTVAGTGVTVGKPSQYAVTLSLSGTKTVQLTPGLTDPLGNVTTEVAGTFTYRSRNQQVRGVALFLCWI